MADDENVSSHAEGPAAGETDSRKRVEGLLRRAVSDEKAGRVDDARRRALEALECWRSEVARPVDAAGPIYRALVATGAFRSALAVLDAGEALVPDRPEEEATRRLFFPLIRAGLLDLLGDADAAMVGLHAAAGWAGHFFGPKHGLGRLSVDAWRRLAEAMVAPAANGTPGMRPFFRALAAELGESVTDEELDGVVALLEIQAHVGAGERVPEGLVHQVQAANPALGSFLDVCMTLGGDAGDRPLSADQLERVQNALAEIERATPADSLDLARVTRALVRVVQADSASDPLALVNATGHALRVLGHARAGLHCPADALQLQNILRGFVIGPLELPERDFEQVLFGLRRVAIGKLIASGRTEAVLGALDGEAASVPAGCESEAAQICLLASIAAFEIGRVDTCEQFLRAAVGILVARPESAHRVRLLIPSPDATPLWVRLPEKLPAGTLAAVSAHQPPALALVIRVVLELAERLVSLDSALRSPEKCAAWSAWAAQVLLDHRRLLGAGGPSAPSALQHTEFAWGELRWRAWYLSAAAALDGGRADDVERAAENARGLMDPVSAQAVSQATCQLCLVTVARLDARRGSFPSNILPCLLIPHPGHLPSAVVAQFLQLLLAEDPQAALHFIDSLAELDDADPPPLEYEGPPLTADALRIFDQLGRSIQAACEIARRCRMRLWTPLWRAEALRLVGRHGDAVRTLDDAATSLQGRRRERNARDSADGDGIAALAEAAYRLAWADLAIDAPELEDDTREAVVEVLNGFAESELSALPVLRGVHDALAARLCLADGDLRSAASFARNALRALRVARKAEDAVAAFTRGLLPAAWQSRGLALRVWADVQGALADIAPEGPVASRHRAIRDRCERVLGNRTRGLWGSDRLFERLWRGFSPGTADDASRFLRQCTAAIDRCADECDAEALAVRRELVRAGQIEAALLRNEVAEALLFAERRTDPFARRDALRLGGERTPPNAFSLAEIPIEYPGSAALLLDHGPDEGLHGFLWLPSDDGRRLRAASVAFDSGVPELRAIGDELGMRFLAGHGLDAPLLRALGERFWTARLRLGRIGEYLLPEGDDDAPNLLSLVERAGVDRIVIVPCADLAGVPFHAAEVVGGNAVLAHFGVSYLPSPEAAGRVLRASEAPHLPAAHLVNPTGDLVHAVHDGRAVERAFPGARAIRLPEWPCTRRRFLEETRDVGWLHVAAHGVPTRNHADRLRAGIRLLPNTEDDGLVTVADLLGNGSRPLQPGATVVLAACEAARHARSPLLGEPASLALSLLELVPCRRVIAPAWPVHDVSAAAMMEAFYGEIAAGREVWDAFRRAQIALRSGELAARMAALHTECPSRQRCDGSFHVVPAATDLPDSASSDWAAWLMLGL